MNQWVVDFPHATPGRDKSAPTHRLEPLLFVFFRERISLLMQPYCYCNQENACNLYQRWNLAQTTTTIIQSSPVPPRLPPLPDESLIQ
jgi:hypothetical protein